MPLPNFLVIGAAKAGTTSLYHYLRQHPDIFMSALKEPQYFCADDEIRVPHAIRTRREYERLFEDGASRKARGEASPQYVRSATACDRIAADLPGVRLIVSLRNPADRAYSSYLGALKNGRERRTADEAMRPGTFYFETSRYHPQLARYFARFPPARIKVLLFDDLIADARAVVREISRFLDVDAAFDADVSTRHNPALVPRSLSVNALLWKSVETVHRLLPRPLRGTGLGARAQRPLLRRPDPLPAGIRARMLDELRDDLTSTGALIGRDLSHWLSAAPRPTQASR